MAPEVSAASGEDRSDGERLVVAPVGLARVLARVGAERGQDMVEYAGVLIVVAAIVLVVAGDGGSIAHWITSGISKEINNIFGGG